MQMVTEGRALQNGTYACTIALPAYSQEVSMSRSAGSDAVDAQISMEMLTAFLQALRVQQCLITLYVQTV